MEHFYSELKRRKVINSLLLYAMGVWLILQVVDVVSEPLLLPAWLPRALIIAAAIGFPIVACLSWIFDFTRAGLVQTSIEGEGVRPAVGVIPILTLSVAVVAGSALVSRRWSEEPADIAQEQNILSMAILPFDVTDDILQPHLVRLADELIVRIGKEDSIRLASSDAVSALRQTMNLSAQAEQLGVTYLLGGSIEGNSEGVTLSSWVFDSNENDVVWTKEFLSAQLYVVTDLVADDLLEYFGVQSPATTVLTSNAEAYDLYLRGLQAEAADRDLDLATELWLSALDADARFSLPYARLCELNVRLYRSLSQISHFEAAERYCFRALTLDSESLEVHKALGDIYTASGQIQQARDAYNRALAINPEHFRSRLGLARTYLQDNQVLLESMITDIIRDHPGSPAGYQALQNLYFNQGRYAEAVEPARQSYRLRPESDSAKLNLTGNLTMAGEFEEAKSLLLEMLQQESSRVGDIHNVLATVYFFEGEFDQAAELYREARAREPEDPVLARNLADTIWHASDPAAAMPVFEEVVTLSQQHRLINPDDLGSLNSLLVAYGSLGNETLMSEILTSLMEASPNDPQAHYNAAVAYARIGNTELAQEHANHAIEFGYSMALLKADPDIRDVAVDRLPNL